jgi:Xaa-Pro aminopeptidase
MSARNGGPPLPLDGTYEDRPDPLLAVVAVRYAGYWAEGLITVASQPNAALERTEAARTVLVHAVRTGISAAELFRIGRAGIGPLSPHAATAQSIGNGIGLSLEERPILTETNLDQLEEDGVYSLRLGATGKDDDNAILSLMILAKATGVEVLWPPELIATTTV